MQSQEKISKQVKSTHQKTDSINKWIRTATASTVDKIVAKGYMNICPAKGQTGAKYKESNHFA